MIATPGSAEVQLAELFWRHEAEGVPALKAARDQHSFTDQSEMTQAKWLGYASVALRFRLAAKPAEDVREATIKECRKICDGIADKYDNIARNHFKKRGESSACAAREAAYEIEEAILALSTPGQPKP